jgi:hypothetical protein
MNKPSRRAVVRTGVWAVPVVATAAVAPAFAAASCSDCVTITGFAGGCKMPGKKRGKSYAITLNVTNPGAPQTMTISGIVVTGAPLVQECPESFLVPTGNSQIVLFVSDITNSQQKAATVTITYFSNPKTLSTFSFDIDGFHPFDDATCPKTLEPPADCIG